RRDEVIRYANRLLTERRDDPAAVYHASAALIETFQGSTVEEARPVLGKLIEPLRDALPSAIRIANQTSAHDPAAYRFWNDVISGIGLNLGFILGLSQQHAEA